jgi:2-O-methyltransferase
MEIQPMKNKYRKLLFLCLYFHILNFSVLRADYYEGIGLFSSYSAINLDLLPQFLPYNPVILEAGAFRGQDTVRAAKIWPNGHIIAFEPDPNNFKELEKNVAEAQVANVDLYSLALNSYNGSALFNICLGPNNNEPAYGYASSLLPLKKGMEIYCKGPQIEVPCVTLDKWCTENQIESIDLLHLEMEGAEYGVLKSSPNILKKVKVLYIKTYIHPHRLGMTNYSALKEFLEKSNFVLLSHRYQPDVIGHAIFLSRELFDAYFKLSLGMYLEV